MAKAKALNVSEMIGEYDDNFIDSISLKDVTNCKELKELLLKLEKANYVVTTFYETMYNDYITMINNDCLIQSHGIDIDTVRKYKSLAAKVQKAYYYVLYLNTFDNPFKVSTRK